MVRHMRAAGNLRPQLPAAQQDKTVGRTELPHQRSYCTSSGCAVGILLGISTGIYLAQILSLILPWMACGHLGRGPVVLRNDQYVRLQMIFLAMSKHSGQPPERARWLALVQACQEELLTAEEMRPKLDPNRQRAA